METDKTSIQATVMPAELATIDSTQSQQADKVSAVTQRQSGEAQQTTTAFSYAEAAKGRSPSVPSALTPEMNPAEMNGKKAPLSETDETILESGRDVGKRTASEGRVPEGNNLQDRREDNLVLPSDSQDILSDTVQGSISETTKMDSVLENPTVAGQSQPAASTPSSPEYGTTSTSTLPKEDDVFSTTNGSSDSTSDKQSQTSQNGIRISEKADVEKGHNTSTVWEEEIPAPAPTLKEAAPPPVNVWQLRSQNQAKAKASALVQPTKPMANPTGNNSSLGKGNERNTELKKQESRKKPKAALGLTDERSSTGLNKEGSKPADTVEKNGLGSVAPPPPPSDAMSWPKPDSAIGEGRKKNSERVEKPEKETTQPSKPHGKEKWVPVPYVPTAVFSTPLPQARRGGRGPSRGGRETESRGRNTVTAGHGPEKPTVAGVGSGQTNATGGQDRGRQALTSAAQNSNVTKSKRASSAGPSTPREQRKPDDVLAPEKRKDSDVVTTKVTVPNSNSEFTLRRPSVPTTMRDSQAVQPSVNDQDNEPAWISTTVENDAGGNHKFRNEVSDGNGQPRAGHERRSEGSVRSPEFPRDFQNSFPARERGDIRGDRGRGGFRGRGGNSHAFYNPSTPNGHGFSNGHQSQYQSSTGSPSKSHSNHDRLSAQAQGPTFQQAHHQPRHYRHGSRSHSIPHSTQYGRFTNVQQSGPPHLANLQTDLANEYGYLPVHQGAMSAMPFNSFGEQPSVFGMVNLQMNYYFSVENLCKDLYLRSHMDSQGFVFLELLAQFNRIKQLTNDMDLIRLACHHSQTIEYVNVDGIDRVRAREGWQQWVRKMEERDPSARNDGPSVQDVPQYSQSLNYVPQSEERQIVSPGSNVIGNGTDNIQFQPLNGIIPPFGQNSNGIESNGLDASAIKTPLSAAVSEFSPSGRSSKSRNFSTADYHTQGTSVFTDAQVENLRILVRKPLNAAASMPPPFHSSSSRTFSNGSIDGRSINDELSKFGERQTKSTINGDASER